MMSSSRVASVSSATNRVENDLLLQRNLQLDKIVTNLKESLIDRGQSSIDGHSAKVYKDMMLSNFPKIEQIDENSVDFTVLLERLKKKAEFARCMGEISLAHFETISFSIFSNVGNFVW